MFGYLRPFSIVSLVAVIIIAILAGLFFYTTASDNLTHMVGRNNATVAEGYINTVWKKYREVIVPISDDPIQLRNNPQVLQFAQDTARYFQYMPLLRVNIYNANGLLMMSADISIANKFAGDSASPDNDFISSQMKREDPISQIIHHAPLQNTPRATLIQTVVPFHQDGNSHVSEGALEILSNVTGPWNELVNFQMLSTGGVIALFLIFLGMLSLTSRKAETIIARQHEANLELAAAAAAAQAENRDKSQFLANISHELRTPLNAVIGFSDIIRNEVMPGVTERKYHDYINDIHASGVHLLSLINDILDYSKAEAGKLELEVSEINATKMVQNCIRLVGPRAESGNVNLVETLPKEPFVMVTDGKKFKQILLNLLSNAVKFTPADGSVYVTGWHNVREDSFSFEVRDTGIGIAPKDISRAMAAFGQVDNTLKRKYEGTGLGLPLTKKFVELMDGKFTIESQINVGTRITFTLPREIQEHDGIVIKQVL